jgi:hypothetical protein
MYTSIKAQNEALQAQYLEGVFGDPLEAEALTTLISKRNAALVNGQQLDNLVKLTDKFQEELISVDVLPEVALNNFREGYKGIFKVTESKTPTTRANLGKGTMEENLQSLNKVLYIDTTLLDYLAARPELLNTYFTGRTFKGSWTQLQTLCNAAYGVARNGNETLDQASHAKTGIQFGSLRSAMSRDAFKTDDEKFAAAGMAIEIHDKNLVSVSPLA